MIVKKLQLVFSGFVLLLWTTSVHAQESTAGNFLIISPSPLLNAMGGVGTALPTSDPFGLFYNPAQLGQVGRDQNIGIHLYPTRVRLSDESKPTFKSSAAVVGLSASSRTSRSPLSFGVGFLTSELERGTGSLDDLLQGSNNEFLLTEYFNAFSFGFGLDLYLRFSIGFTYKRIVSDLGLPLLNQNEFNRSREETGVWDYGILVTLPITRYLGVGRKSEESRLNNFAPFADFSVGYAKTNIGEEIAFSNDTPPVPLPRYGSLGYGLSLGLDITYRRVYLRAINLQFSAEARDPLLKMEDTDLRYQSFGGDISIADHLIGLSGDENVQSRYGYSIELAEFLRLSRGVVDGLTYNSRESWGYGIRSKGIFNFLRKKYTTTWYYYFFERVDLQFYYASYYTDNQQKSNFYGIAIGFSGR